SRRSRTEAEEETAGERRLQPKLEDNAPDAMQEDEQAKAHPPIQLPAPRDEGGEVVPQELQKAIDQVGRAVRSGRPAKLPELPSPLPDLILIDGGKGQLNAACAELAKLGVSNIPIIGLAKEFEEIYRPGQAQ